MQFRRQTNQEVTVNLTPLIDVVFLLLIFFMVSTSFTKETHLSLNLPEASGDESVVAVDAIEVTISSSGNYAVNGRTLVSSNLANLQKALTEVSGGNIDLPLVITADAKTPHQAVITAMDAAGKQGFAKLSLTTQQPATE
ncbi:ExbD/TolR family protein [Dasania marina]|uniref:ExbD/TolR family protein n=1 Tax=Dasania marina TaxID=471499 RepID=UPI00037DF47B|nr:biopolymer transporter ExbD [Dasania marina]